jgi:hypothetical protein
VTLPLLFTVVVLASATIFRMRSTQNEDHAIGSRTAHEFLAYDVFISYRSPRRHIVKDVLMVALAGLVRADGSKLNIFWDNKSLHRGDFEPQLQRAILESRVFVALLTSEYFDIDRPYCRWEMKTAKGSGKEIVLIIGDAQYDPQNPPEEFSWLKPLHHYNLDDEDFAEKFRKEVGAAEANYGKRITSS